MKKWTAALIVAGCLVVPTLARADGGMEMGALGGAMAGSLMGPGDERVEHAVIGAVVGALLGAAIDTEEQSRTWNDAEYAVTYPTTRYRIVEPVHYRDAHRWDRHRHHHHRDRHGHHHRQHHWRSWD
ncbi:MAG: glycine zipper 2TM domain-containing protein [Magnetococcales bacterium]|nr:glycine zipper 2TM domain-containing protein [Magnetococcales bacterium]